MTVQRLGTSVCAWRAIAPVRACLCAAALAIGGCGGADGGSADGGTTGGGTASGRIVDDPETAPSLEARVATAFADASRHESWICTGGARLTEYLLVVTDGVHHGQSLERGVAGAVPTAFDWSASGTDALLLDYGARAPKVELVAIRLGNGDDTLDAIDGAHGPVRCRRERYVDGQPTRDAAGVTLPDGPAARALATRLETRYDGAGDFDFWACARESGAPLGYLLLGDDDVASGRRAFAFAFDDAVPAYERALRWATTDGDTLALWGADTDAPAADGAGAWPKPTVAVTAAFVEDIVFAVDEAFVATRADEALQCLRRAR